MGSDVYRADRNEVPYAPLPGVVAAVEKELRQTNRYPDPCSSGLVQSVARHFSLPSANVVVGPGGTAVMQLLLRTAVSPGDEVLASRLSSGLGVLDRSIGARFAGIPLAGAEQDLEALAATVSDRTRAIVVSSPNDPTGTTVSHVCLLELLGKVPSGVLVVIDERYREFITQTGMDGTTIQASVADGVSLLRDWPNVCVVRTFSHAYGLAALRVGYALAGSRTAAAARAAALPFAVSGLAQAAAIASLAAEEELASRVSLVARERDRMVRALSVQGWDVPASQANFLWLPLGRLTREFAQACAEHHVLVHEIPGSGARITVGVREANDVVLFVASRFAGGWRRTGLSGY
ncbi:aminotransferase class I/II-fold pyridoxal phosphate-dependent enzyme [Streptomyces lasalocidi]